MVSHSLTDSGLLFTPVRAFFSIASTRGTGVYREMAMMTTEYLAAPENTARIPPAKAALPAMMWR